METIPLRVKARVASRAEANVHLERAGDATIVERGGLRWLVMSCPCGCGAALPVNLDPRAGPAWRLYDSPRGLSVYPSVWRDTDCKSHFIIWRGRILLLGARQEDDWIEYPEEAPSKDLLESVRKTLSARPQSAEGLSDQIAGRCPVGRPEVLSIPLSARHRLGGPRPYRRLLFPSVKRCLPPTLRRSLPAGLGLH